MKLKFIAIMISLAALASACTVIGRQAGTIPPKTQLETREFQTRMFDTNDTKLIMKAVLNVLQDDGFVVKNAVVDLGLLTATKEIDLKKSGKTNKSDQVWIDILSAMFNSRNTQSSPEQTYSKIKIIEVSVNVSDYGRQSKVRANFQAKVIDNKGDPVEVETVDDPKFYQDFFMKVDKGVFIQKQGR